jgi:hypothetical protein
MFPFTNNGLHFETLMATDIKITSVSYYQCMLLSLVKN